MNANVAPRPETVLNKIELCMQGSTNLLQLQVTQAFFALYYQRYGHPLPDREMLLTEQLLRLQERLKIVS